MAAHFVIVGSGVAGISAAAAIRGQEPRAQITLVGDEPQGYYSRPGLAYYLSNEIPRQSLYPFQAQDFEQLDLKRVHGQVVRIDAQEHRLEVVNGDLNSLPYDRLLLATGAFAVPLKVPGASRVGVVKLDNFADAEQIISRARKGQRAVVVGGGITALELVEGLRQRGMHVTYLLRGDRYWSAVLDETESAIVEKRLEHEGVQILRHTELESIEGTHGRVDRVVTRDGREIPCRLLAAAIGVQARTQLAAASGLQVERGILVNERLRTSDADIYAAGDAAQAYDQASGRHVLDTLWNPARQQGRVAGLNMCGSDLPYVKETAFNVTRLAGLTTTLIGTVGGAPNGPADDPDLAGIARGDSETWRLMPDAMLAENHFEVNRLRLVVGKQRLLGAVVMGDQALSQPLLDLIVRQVDISPVREKLLQPGQKIGDVVLDFWTKWRQAGVGG